MTTIGVHSKTKVIMKKTVFFIMSLCALTFLSCQKEEMGGDVSGSEGAYTYIFNGAAGPETKISIGEKTAAGWPVHWLKNDVINIFNSSDGKWSRCGTAKLQDAYADKTNGSFTLTSSNAIKGDVFIIHCSDEGRTLDGSVLSSPVPSEQEVNGSGFSAHIGKSGLAYAKAKVNGTSVPVDFMLEHKSAFVRLVLNTSEFNNHTLLGATIWSKGAALAGTMSLDFATGKVSTAGAADYVKVSIKDGNEKAFGSKAELWLSALPADLSRKTVWIIVHMKKDNATVTVPVQINGGKLIGGSVNTITISDLKTSSAPAWYETVETRYIAAYGEGWCYGPANTFVGYFSTPFTFDVKARGNFMKCVEPKAMKVYYACSHNTGNNTNLKFNSTNAYDGSQYIKYNLDNTYTVTMTALGAGSYTGYSSKVLLLDANGKTIWAFNVWGNKDQLGEQTLANGVILDRNIGSTKHDTDYYKSSSYYQWGRPFNIEWSTSFYTKSTTPAESLEMSASNPQVAYHKDKGNWYAGPEGDGLNDLWGNDQSSAAADALTAKKGVKSIYDPCPAGYMVASPAVLNNIKTGATVHTSGDGNYKWLKNGNVYVPYAGGKWTNGGNMDNNSNAHAVLWSNSSYPEAGRSYGIKYSGSWDQLKHYRAMAWPVRCMKDTENR